MLRRHTYAHIHRDKNFPWMYVFSIMYCGSASWEASIGARGLCEEMELWDRAPVDRRQRYTSKAPGLLSDRQPGLLGEPQARERFVSKSKTDGSKGTTPEVALYLHMHEQTHHTERRSSSLPSREPAFFVTTQPLEWQGLNFSSLWCFVMQPAWTDSLHSTVTVVNTLTNTFRIF